MPARPRSTTPTFTPTMARAPGSTSTSRRRPSVGPAEGRRMIESETDSRDASPDQVTIVGTPREESEDLHASAAEAGWLGRYVPLKRVGRGAFGAVYAAYDPQLDRKIALKVLRAERQTPHNRIRLLREARALAAVSHPNVVSV